MDINDPLSVQGNLEAAERFVASYRTLQEVQKRDADRRHHIRVKPIQIERPYGIDGRSSRRALLLRLASLASHPR